MANKTAILRGTYASGPKAGLPCDMPCTVIDTDANYATFTTRPGTPTVVSFGGDVDFYDLQLTGAVATITRVVPEVDGTLANEHSVIAAFAADPKTDTKDRFGSPWRLPMGAMLALHSKTV